MIPFRIKDKDNRIYMVLAKVDYGCFLITDLKSNEITRISEFEMTNDFVFDKLYEGG